MKPTFKRCLLATAVAATGLPSVSAIAQDEDTLLLEEIVVTSQMRKESLQDVSVSVSALDGEKIVESGINKVEELQAYVPNLTMSETALGTNIYVRGIGSGINQGFEQSVGMYVDGVYYGRAQLTRAPFMDLERVEVLRGPQNVLYGKNSIAGALSVVTNKAETETGGMISALFEPEYGEKVIDGVFNYAISDSMAARIAIRKRQMDGYLENLTTGDDEPERDETTVRANFDWAINDQLSANLKVEKGSFDIDGRQIEIIGDSGSLNPSPLLNGVSWSNYLIAQGADASTANVTVDGKRSANGDSSDNETQNITLKFDYDMNGYTLTSITSKLAYEYDELCDCDFTGANLFFVNSQEDYDQVSQEFKITSPTDGKLEWMAGLYYQDSELEFKDNFFNDAQSQALANVVRNGLLSRAQGLSNAATAAAAQGNAALATQLTAQATGAQTFAGRSAGILTGLSVPREFTQDSTIMSLFASFTYKFTDQWHVTLGGRYSDEDKEAKRDLNAVLNPASAANPVLAATVGPFLQNVFNVETHSGANALTGERSESNFSPAFTVEYFMNDDTMFYATATRGYKSGGFDVRSNGIPGSTNTFLPGTFEYDEEEAQSVELGVKTKFANGRGELNAALFRTNYDDLQVSIYDGVLGFNVQNAAEATSEGVEIDSRFLVSENWTVGASIAYLDFEFDEFKNGQCTQLKRIQRAFVNNNSAKCDATGQTNQYVADWSGVLNATYNNALTEGLMFTASFDGIFTSEYNPSQNLDPSALQNGYLKLNARFALSDVDEKWSVALIGKNLNDKSIVAYANDTPLQANLSQSIGYYGMVEPGRTLALQGTYRF